MNGADFYLAKDGFLIVISGFGGNYPISTRVIKFVPPKATIQALLQNDE